MNLRDKKGLDKHMILARLIVRARSHKLPKESLPQLDGAVGSIPEKQMGNPSLPIFLQMNMSEKRKRSHRLMGKKAGERR